MATEDSAKLRERDFLRGAFVICEGQQNEVGEGSPRRLAEMIRGVWGWRKGWRRAMWGLDKSSPARWRSKRGHERSAEVSRGKRETDLSIRTVLPE